MAYNLLCKRLPVDVVKYCIVPFLMPSQELVRNRYSRVLTLFRMVNIGFPVTIAFANNLYAATVPGYIKMKQSLGLLDTTNDPMIDDFTLGVIREHGIYYVELRLNNRIHFRCSYAYRYSTGHLRPTHIKMFGQLLFEIQRVCCRIRMKPTLDQIGIRTRSSNCCQFQ
jgi:hypothetical protein